MGNGNYIDSFKFNLLFSSTCSLSEYKQIIIKSCLNQITMYVRVVVVE